MDSEKEIILGQGYRCMHNLKKGSWMDEGKFQVSSLEEDRIGTRREGETKGDCEAGMTVGGQNEELCCCTSVSGIS